MGIHAPVWQAGASCLNFWSMYLSRILLDVSKKNTLQALSNPNRFHGSVERCFSGERKRNLWRIDNLNGRLYLLILSEDVPDLKMIEKQFSPAYEHGETKSYDKLLERIKKGSSWQFRIVANPTKSLSSRDGSRGKVIAISDREHQKEWLMKKGEKNGFHLEKGTFDVVQGMWHIFSKRKNNTSMKVSLKSVAFEGKLEITDEEKFKYALVKGIGKEKAYGNGLMTII